jgi:RNA polymerase sigma-70 factor (ECF subfamily)
MTLDPSEAEDLVGQVLLLAARGWADFDGRHPRSWLLRILKNEAQKRSGSQKAHLQLFDDHGELADNDTERRINDRLTAEAIHRELMNLPWAYRIAVVLCDEEQLTYEEAADVLDVPMGTIRSRLFRGRKLLQRKLRPWSD